MCHRTVSRKTQRHINYICEKQCSTVLIIILPHEGFSDIEIVLHVSVVVDLQIQKVGLKSVLQQMYSWGCVIIVVIEIFCLHAFQCPKDDVIYMREEDEVSIYDKQCCKSTPMH